MKVSMFFLLCILLLDYFSDYEYIPESECTDCVYIRLELEREKCRFCKENFDEGIPFIFWFQVEENEFYENELEFEIRDRDGSGISMEKKRFSATLDYGWLRWKSYLWWLKPTMWYRGKAFLIPKLYESEINVQVEMVRDNHLIVSTIEDQPPSRISSEFSLQLKEVMSTFGVSYEGILLPSMNRSDGIPYVDGSRFSRISDTLCRTNDLIAGLNDTCLYEVDENDERTKFTSSFGDIEKRIRFSSVRANLSGQAFDADLEQSIQSYSFRRSFFFHHFESQEEVDKFGSLILPILERKFSKTKGSTSNLRIILIAGEENMKKLDISSILKTTNTSIFVINEPDLSNGIFLTKQVENIVASSAKMLTDYYCSEGSAGSAHEKSICLESDYRVSLLRIFFPPEIVEVERNNLVFGRVMDILDSGIGTTSSEEYSPSLIDKIEKIVPHWSIPLVHFLRFTHRNRYELFPVLKKFRNDRLNSSLNERSEQAPIRFLVPVSIFVCKNFLKPVCLFLFPLSWFFWEVIFKALFKGYSKMKGLVIVIAKKIILASGGSFKITLDIGQDVERFYHLPPFTVYSGSGFKWFCWETMQSLPGLGMLGIEDSKLKEEDLETVKSAFHDIEICIRNSTRNEFLDVAFCKKKQKVGFSLSEIIKFRNDIFLRIKNGETSPQSNVLKKICIRMTNSIQERIFQDTEEAKNCTDQKTNRNERDCLGVMNDVKKWKEDSMLVNNLKIFHPHEVKKLKTVKKELLFCLKSYRESNRSNSQIIDNDDRNRAVCTRVKRIIDLFWRISNFMEISRRHVQKISTVYVPLSEKIYSGVFSRFEEFWCNFRTVKDWEDECQRFQEEVSKFENEVAYRLSDIGKYEDINGMIALNLGLFIKFQKEMHSGIVDVSRKFDELLQFQLKFKDVGLFVNMDFWKEFSSIFLFGVKSNEVNDFTVAGFFKLLVKKLSCIEDYLVSLRNLPREFNRSLFLPHPKSIRMPGIREISENKKKHKLLSNFLINCAKEKGKGWQILVLKRDMDYRPLSTTGSFACIYLDHLTEYSERELRKIMKEEGVDPQFIDGLTIVKKVNKKDIESHIDFHDDEYFKKSTKEDILRRKLRFISSEGLLRVGEEVENSKNLEKDGLYSRRNFNDNFIRIPYSPFIMRMLLVDCFDGFEVCCPDIDGKLQSRSSKVCYITEYGFIGLDNYLHILRVKGRKLSVQSFLHISAQMILAIIHLQSYNIVHGDVHEGNFVISPKGFVKLIDFMLSIDCVENWVLKGKDLCNIFSFYRFKRFNGSVLPNELRYIDDEPDENTSVNVKKVDYHGVGYVMKKLEEVTENEEVKFDELKKIRRILCKVMVSLMADYNERMEISDAWNEVKALLVLLDERKKGEIEASLALMKEWRSEEESQKFLNGRRISAKPLYEEDELPDEID